MGTRRARPTGWVGLWCIAAALAGCTNDSDVGAGEEAVHDIDVFELDGNQPDDPAVTGDDWSSVFAGTGNESSTTGRIVDAPGASIFTGGGSKDYLDVDDGPWLHKNGSVPPKDDLQAAFAAAYEVEDDFIVYFGAERNLAGGSAELGFWFFQNQVSPNPLTGNTGTFTGEHMVGDLLILASFTQGGAVSDIDIYQWVGSGGSDGALNKITDDPSDLLVVGDCEDVSLTDDDACAITNADNTFFEGGINLSSVFDGQVPCFSSFMAVTRSSHEVNAVLKDFVVGAFEACSFEIAKECGEGDYDNATGEFFWDVTITATNTGGNTLYDITIVDDNGTEADTSDDTTHVIDQLAPDAMDSVTFEIRSTSNGITNHATATAAVSDGGEQVIIAPPATDSCPGVTRTPVVEVTKECETRLDWTSGSVVVEVDFDVEVCNEDAAGTPGVISLDTVTLYNTHCTASEDDDTVLTTFTSVAPGECETYSDDYAPASVDDPASSAPFDAEFTDCVRVAATNTVFGSATDAAEATCRLCPTCEELMCAPEA
jgi:hypothetical protein